MEAGQLLVNITNVIHAACLRSDDLQDIVGAARTEAESCFEAAQLQFIPADEVIRRGIETLPLRTIDGQPFPGGSTAQDLGRGAATSEVDYLNGEICLLGRSLGIPTPVNSFLQRLMREMIKRRLKPGSIPSQELRQQISAAGGERCAT